MTNMTDEQLIEKCESSLQHMSMHTLARARFTELLTRFKALSTWKGDGKDGSDEDLAIELVARFSHKTYGRNGRWNEQMRSQFVDGALWMKKRLQSQPAPVSVEEIVEAYSDAIAEQNAKQLEAGNREPLINNHTVEILRIALTTLFSKK